MSRPVCPELYPDPRPSRLFAPLLPYLPRLLRLLPWVGAAPVAGAAGMLAVSTLPLLPWLIVTVAVLTPIAAGVALFNIGWD